ncbi:MAG: sulfatase-like hydrolase/transferase [Chthoniobacteraceae bacterium]
MSRFLLTLIALALSAVAAEKPNILIIVADDLGYADIGFQGAKDVPTPHLDALAARSVRCTSGYVSHPFCSPTRAGLLTGRYQQRFGHENNPAWLPESTVAGLPLSETTMPQVIASAGYKTGAVGKWHLGAHPQFHPNRRGFADYFGALGGGHIYMPGSKGGAEYNIPLDRNGAPETHTKYLTDHFGEEAAAFISRHEKQPWLLYLAFNAPHTPMQATEKYLDRVKTIADEKRRTYAAMICAMDDAIGAALAAVKAAGDEEKTLVFFISDNGGPISVNASLNTPLNGAKGSVQEGGVRVPFLVSWPAKLPRGKDYAQPVIALDFFATAVAVSGATLPAGVKLDGVNLIPFLSGEMTGAPHKHLFWRTGGGDQLAVRAGDWKWMRRQGGQPQLYNLASDIGEATDIAAKEPAKAAELEKIALAWSAELVRPIFESPKPGKKQPAKK